MASRQRPPRTDRQPLVAYLVHGLIVDLGNNDGMRQWYGRLRNGHNIFVFISVYDSLYG